MIFICMKRAVNTGAIVSAINVRKRALERYYESPKTCLHCKSIIVVESNQKASDVRKRKFCNQSCAAQFNNHKRKKPKLKKEKVNRFNTLIGLTKGDIFKTRKSWQHARSDIRKHAIYIYRQLKKVNECSNCGYDKHVEIAHIKAVSDFSEEILVTIINDPSNLIALCPNCHWEFDNGLLKLNIGA